MKDKNYLNLSFEEAIEWAEERSKFADERKRMKSRQVVFLLLEKFKESCQYILSLENAIIEFKKILQEQQNIINFQKEKIEKLEK